MSLTYKALCCWAEGSAPEKEQARETLLVMLGALPNCSHCFSAPLTDRYGAQSLAFRPALRQQIASRHGLGRSSLLVSHKLNISDLFKPLVCQDSTCLAHRRGFARYPDLSSPCCIAALLMMRQSSGGLQQQAAFHLLVDLRFGPKCPRTHADSLKVLQAIDLGGRAQVVRCQRPPPSTRGGRGGGSSNYRGGGSSRGGGGGQSGGRGYQGTSTGGRGYQGSNPRGGGTSQPGRGGYQGRNFNPGYQGNRGGYQGRGRGGQLYQVGTS